MILFGLLICLAFAPRASALERYAPEEVLFSLYPGAGKVTVAGLVGQLQQRYGPLAVDRLFEQERRSRGKANTVIGLHDWYRMRLGPEYDPAQVAGELSQWAQIEHAQPNYLRREALAVEDSLFSVQWNLAAMGWRSYAAGELEPVVVAIVDSGLDYNHPDIAGQLWHNIREEQGEAGVDDDGNGYVDDLIGWDFSDAPSLSGEGDYLERDADPMDESGHGTHVAGIVAAIAGNGLGIAGVAPQVKLMVLRAGFNLPGGGYLQDDDIAAALIYAAENGARVVNMSWGDPEPSPLIEAAVRFAAERDLVLVAASGNEGSSEIFYPARSDLTIAVGASAPGGGILTFSNHGQKLDLVAPGHAIWSLLPGGGYIERSGTSMSAAHVSGLAGLVLGQQPQWTSAQVRGALLLSAQELGASGWDPFAGAGQVHFAAIDVANPPVVQIVKPTSDTVQVGEIAVELGLAGVDQYELSWGLGAAPGRWNLLQTGKVDKKSIRVTWDTAALIDGAYVLRLRGLAGQGWLEQRVELQLVAAGPEAKGARLVRVLAGPGWTDLVEWQTARPAAGTVFLDRDSETAYRLVAPPARREQRLKLPVDLQAGSYQVWVQAGAGDLAGPRISAGSVEPFAHRVDRWAFNRHLTLPDGYLMPTLSDFNGDGLTELVQMSYGGGLQYNTGDFYQYGLGAGERVYNSLQLFIPWGVQDGDGDGLLELMAVDALRVRLLEAPSAGAFPERLIWEQRDVWGGEAADLDEDGLPELFLRSATGPFFQVFESTADNEFAEIAVLANPGEGSNQLGQRQVVGDLDGDGRGELVSGDEDGDLFVYERVADDAYRSGWQQAGSGDARIVGGGLDLDGDGVGEFAVARFFNDPFDVEARHWQVEVYAADGDNHYAPEWQLEVLGGKPGGSGIGVGDLDGDGVVEWVLLTVPNLYVFRATGSDTYDPVWHTEISETHRPLIGDLDGDGLADLIFNGDDKIEVFSLAREASAVEKPAGFTAYPLGAEAIGLEWQGVPGAIGYRVLRDGEMIAESHGSLAFVDAGLQLREAHGYRVAAIGPTGTIGPFTAEQFASAAAAPQLISLQRVSSLQLALEFDTEMEDAPAYRFRVEPDLGPVVVAVADRGGRRMVLSFGDALPDSGQYTLSIVGLRTKQGGPLVDPAFSFVLAPLVQAGRPLRAEVLSALSVAIYFDKHVAADGDLRAAFAFVDSSLHIATVEAVADRVVLELATPLRPVGRSYGIRIAGLRDEDGLEIEGAVSFRYAAADLSAAIAFPNPFRPHLGELTFGFLPLAAELAIFATNGMLVRTLVEREGDGGVQWDGRNQAGQLVGAGIYWYRISAGNEVKMGKLALLRD